MRSRQSHFLAYSRLHRQTDEQTGSQSDEQTGRKSDRQMVRQTGRETAHTKTQRERESESETDRDRERDGDRDRERETETERDRQIETERQTETEGQRETQTDRQTQTERRTLKQAGRETRSQTRGRTHCVLSVKAALVMEEGRLRPLVISLHSFLLMTSTRPPLDTTRRNSSYRSSVCLAMMGMRFTGDPEKQSGKCTARVVGDCVA